MYLEWVHGTRTERHASALTKWITDFLRGSGSPLAATLLTQRNLLIHAARDLKNGLVYQTSAPLSNGWKIQKSAPSPSPELLHEKVSINSKFKIVFSVRADIFWLKNNKIPFVPYCEIPYIQFLKRGNGNIATVVFINLSGSTVESFNRA